MRRWFTVPGSCRLMLLATVMALAGCSPAASTGADPSSVSSPAARASAQVGPSVAATGSPATPATQSAEEDAPWRVVAIGDSIPFNSPDDCPGCTGFVDGYAARLQEATGHAVVATNLSQHNGLQASGLSAELDTDTSRRDAIAGADIVIVSIGHNDTPWNATDDACDGPALWDGTLTSNIPSAKKYTEACAQATAAAYEPLLTSIYKRIVELRAGKPTVFLALNTYNDFLGWCELRGCGGEAVVPPEIDRAVRIALEPWNKMTCDTAAAQGLVCADVYHLFGGPDAMKPSGDLLGVDYTHPSQAGNDLIADYLVSLGYAPLEP